MDTLTSGAKGILLLPALIPSSTNSGDYQQTYERGTTKLFCGMEDRVHNTTFSSSSPPSR